MTSPHLLRFAAALNAQRSPLRDHQRTALTARAYAELLTPGEMWFLDSVLKLSALSDKQQSRLNEIAGKIERGRK